jgi:phage-related protein
VAKNQVTLTLAGDAKSLERAFDRAGDASKGMADDFEQAGKRSRRAADGIDKVGEKAGDTEGKASGLADVMDGLNTAFGLGLDRQIEYARAAGDVLGGFEQLKGVASGAVKSIGKVAEKWGDSGKAAVAAKVQTVKTAAVQSAAWIKSSAQAMASAIKVRAAWLISMGPIALVVVAIGAAVFLIIKYWDEVKGAARATWEWVRDRFSDLKDFFVTWAPLLLGPIGLVIKEWDKLVAGATALWEGIKAGWDAIVGVPAAILGFIRTGVTGALDGLATIGKVVGLAVWDAIKAAWEGVTGVAGALTGMLRAGVTGALDGLATIGKVVAQAVWDAIKGAWEGVTGVASALTDMIRGGVTDALEGIATTAGRIGTAIWSGIKAVWGGLTGKISAAIVDRYE